MEDNYSVIFDGQKVPEESLFSVKQRLKELFKANQARIDALFGGKPVALKRNLSRENALKYQRMLKHAGVDVSVRQVGVARAAETVAPANEGAALTLAPAGSDLVPKESSKETATPSLFKTDQFALAPQDGNLLKPEEIKSKPAVNIDDDAIDWELSKVGENLLKSSEKPSVKVNDIDTSNLSFDDSNKPLSAPAKTVSPSIKTEHIQLQPLDKTDS